MIFVIVLQTSTLAWISIGLNSESSNTISRQGELNTLEFSKSNVRAIMKGICVFVFVLATFGVVSSRSVETGTATVTVRDLNPNDVDEPFFLRLNIENSGKERRLTLRRRDNINMGFPVFTMGTNGRIKEEDVRSEGLTAYHDLDNGAAVLVKSERTASGVYRRSVSGHVDDGTHSIYLEPSKRYSMNARRDVGSGVPHLMTRRKKEIYNFDNGAIRILPPTTDPVPATNLLPPTTDPVRPTLPPTTDPVRPTLAPTTDPVRPTLPPTTDPVRPTLAPPTTDPVRPTLAPPTTDPVPPPTTDPPKKGTRKRTNGSPTVAKRNSDKGQNWVEIIVLCDNACYEWHISRGEDMQYITEYYANAINAADLSFEAMKDPLLYLSVVALYVSTGPDNFTYSDHEGQLIHGNKALQNMIKMREASQLLNHDHMMLFTGYNIYSRQQEYTGTVGESYMGGICGYQRVSVVESKLFFSTLMTTISHELGHNINADHDGEGTGAACAMADQYTMSGGRPQSKDYKNEYLFSPCSIRAFKQKINELNSNGQNCMKNFPEVGPEVPTIPVYRMGQMFDLDKQCEQYYGAGFKFMRGMIAESLMCQNVACINPDGFPEDNRFGAFLGTKCGSQKACVLGDCVYNPSVSRGPDTCIYGDTLMLGMNCEQRAASEPNFCDDVKNRSFCCQSCKDHK